VNETEVPIQTERPFPHADAGPRGCRPLADGPGDTDTNAVCHAVTPNTHRQADRDAIEG